MDQLAAESWLGLRATRFFPARMTAGDVIKTWEARGEVRFADGEESWSAVLEHERAATITYPYEWPFGMLRDAALLQLDLALDALSEGFLLKDASPYNVQWVGTKPVFIDVGSFAPATDGPWVAYRQFCQLQLYPLMLQAYADVPFQPWLRGSLEGIAPSSAAALLRGRARRRKGVLVHVVLHAAAERRAERRAYEVEEIREAGFGPAQLAHNLRGLRKLVGGMHWEPGASAWDDYRAVAVNDEPRLATKDRFVKACLARAKPRLVWDLGCQDGRYSRMAGEIADVVLAMDVEQGQVQRLYDDLHQEDNRTITPLVVDLADPPPALGWRLRERRGLGEERNAPDLILCLALAHHLCVTRGVPLEEFVDWVSQLGGQVVLEFAHPEDAMVRQLVANRRGAVHAGYSLGRLDSAIAHRFHVRDTCELPGGTRTLFWLEPRR